MEIVPLFMSIFFCNVGNKPADFPKFCRAIPYVFLGRANSVDPAFTEAVSKSSSGLEAPPTKDYELFEPVSLP
jgi:hypothetical protein